MVKVRRPEASNTLKSISPFLEFRMSNSFAIRTNIAVMKMKNVVAGKNVKIASPSVSAHTFPEVNDNPILIKNIIPPIAIMFFLVSKSFSNSAIIAPKVENANHGKTGYVPLTKSR